MIPATPLPGTDAGGPVREVSAICGVYLLGGYTRQLGRNRGRYYVGESHDLNGRFAVHSTGVPGIFMDVGGQWVVEGPRMIVVRDDEEMQRAKLRRVSERRFMAAAMRIGLPLLNSPKTLPRNGGFDDLAFEISRLKEAVAILKLNSEPLAPVTLGLLKSKPRPRRRVISIVEKYKNVAGPRCRCGRPIPNYARFCKSCWKEFQAAQEPAA